MSHAVGFYQPLFSFDFAQDEYPVIIYQEEAIAAYENFGL